MRYVQLNDIDDKEIIARNKYLNETFKLFFIKLNGNKLLEFVSIPTYENDCLIVYGHNYAVNNYLEKRIILESKLLLITCNRNLIIPNKLKNKEIYVSKTTKNITYRYEGKEYGFDFDITDTEIMLFRYRTSSFLEQINKSFERVN